MKRVFVFIALLIMAFTGIAFGYTQEGMLYINNGIDSNNNITIEQGRTNGVDICIARNTNKGYEIISRIDDEENSFIIEDIDGNIYEGGLSISKGLYDNYLLSCKQDVEPGMYVLKYTGNKYKALGSARIEVVIGQNSCKNIENSIVEGLKVSPKKTGNSLNWKSIDENFYGYYVVYRSTSKKTGYEKIATVFGKTKYLDNSDIKKGKNYYYRVAAVIDDGNTSHISKKSNTVNVKATTNKKKIKCKKLTVGNELDMSRLKNAKAYGLDSNIKWIDNPQKLSDYENNLEYSFLLGNFDLGFILDDCSKLKEVKKSLTNALEEIVSLRPELIGEYNNSYYYFDVGSIGGKMAIYLKPIDGALSPSDMADNQITALKKAKEIKQQLYDSGKITKNTTDIEKVRIYNEFLQKNFSKVGKGSEAIRGEMMLDDTAYSVIVRKESCCVGKAAAFNLLLHLEGVETQGVGCQGHVLNRCVLEGKEYFNDWGNRLTLLDAKTMSKHFTFIAKSLEKARKSR